MVQRYLENQTFLNDVSESGTVADKLEYFLAIGRGGVYLCFTNTLDACVIVC
jgi:hypothetical protein